jgi:hypothetical protein
MKKLFVLSLLLLSSVIYAQETTEVSISFYQEYSFEELDLSTELDVTTPENVNASFTIYSNERFKLTDFSFALGYSFSDRNIQVVPSLLLGTKLEGNKELFYGYDIDLDVKLFKNISLTGKFKYLHDGGVKISIDGFKTYYSVGIKTKL